MLFRSNPSGSFGKMYPASLLRNQDQRLEPSSRRWGTSGMGGPTASLTLFTSESHNEGGESGYARIVTLSQVLQTGVLPQRFYLSPKACAGILRRASVRGKELPAALKMALEQTASKLPAEPSAPTPTPEPTADRTPTQDD